MRIVEHFGLTDRFAVLAGATYEPGRRTKDEVITHALRELGIDARPARRDGRRPRPRRPRRPVHGIDCIGVLWGYGGDAELTGAGALALAATPADVVELVLAPVDEASPSPPPPDAVEHRPVDRRDALGPGRS